MIYTWKDDSTGVQVEVTRSVKDYTIIPSLAESGLPADKYKKAKWSRVLTGGSFTQGFAAVGKGSKGNW